MNKSIFIILGPTSSGKTSLSLDLCKKFNGEIISADSRQVVKYMDIGTGKVPINSAYEIKKADQVWNVAGINIWGYDLTTPDEYYTGVDWCRFALNKTKELIEKGKRVFVVGGTGFYIDLVIGNKKPSSTKPDLELRKSLETTPTKNLLTWLTSLNPEVITRIDIKNRVRIIRALEIELKRENKKSTPLPYLDKASFEIIGLKGSRTTLYSRVEKWAEEIWENGLIEETTTLLKMGFGNSPKLNGLIYKSTVDFINGKETEEDTLQRIKYDLHAYIRRQETYFKKIPNVSWFDIKSDEIKEKIYTLVNG